MATTQVQGITLRYSHTIGRGEGVGRGFRAPIAVARGQGDLMYVINRPSDQRHDAIRVTICTVGEEYVGEFGAGGLRGQERAATTPFVWPTSIVVNSQGDVFVSDDWLNRICMFDKDGESTGWWGTVGGGDGELNGPSGIVFDPQGNLYVVDSKNNRIQKFTRDGRFLLKWGREGTGNGEFNLPWGIDVDKQGNVYVVDWGNDRVQKFDADGRFILKFGASGNGDGEFNRPTSVAVDKTGIIYVTDWQNDRLQIFERDGSFITKKTGEATLSKWAEEKLDANLDVRPGREVAFGLEREKLFWGPIGVEVDDQDRVFVVESCRARIQVYRKQAPFFTGIYGKL